MKDKFNLPTEVVLFMLIGGYEHYLTDSSAVILLIVCNKHDYMLAGFIWCYDGDHWKSLCPLRYCIPWLVCEKSVWVLRKCFVTLDAEDNETRKKLLPICT